VNELELVTFGTSHQVAPVALRERLAVGAHELRGFLEGCAAAPGVEEVVVISTCNRTEVTVAVSDAVAAETALLGLLALRAGLRPTDLTEVLFAPRNCDAARHLFRVTAGLESMIVGEAEVQGQVKRAYEAALAAGTTGPLTNRLFTAALQAGKRVRAQTRIGMGPSSLSSVAAALAEETLGDLAERSALVVGAGETSELTARALHDRGARTLFVANRHADRARALAERVGGAVVSFDDLPVQLERADIVVTSTSSQQPIVGAEELEAVMATRPERPLLLIDLAVPRDVDAACAALPGVVLRDVDDLSAVVARTHSVREAEARRAEAIVEAELDRFAEWLGGLAVRPTIAALREHGAEIVDQVLAENAGRWEDASPRDLARVEAVARAVVGRLLHEPTIRLRTLGEQQRHGRLQLVRELFGLEDGAPLDAGEDARERSAEVRPLHLRARP
jgi:glutamyl-tRNA reductase